MDTGPDRPSAPAQHHRAWPWELAAAALALLGVGLRLVQARFVFAADQVALPGVDAYYHLWRARMLLQTWPHPPHVDPAISFPGGGPIHWPPGFDSLVAVPGLLGRMDLLPHWGALLAPLLGGLAVYLTWRLGRATLGRPTGLVAAGLMALMPGAIHTTAVGRADHHAIVAPVSLALFLAALASLRAVRPDRRLAWALVAACWASAAMGSWPITPPLLFLPVPILIAWTARADGPARVRPLASVGMVATVIGVGLCVIGSGDLARAPLSLYQPSALHLILYGLAAAGCGLAAWRPRWLGWGALGLVGLAAGLLLAPSIRENLDLALATASGNDPIYAMVDESRSILMPAGRFDLWRPVRSFTALFLLSPLALAALWWRTVKDAGLGLRLIAVFATMGLSLTVLQERFAEFGAPAIALLMAWALTAGGRAVLALFGGTGRKVRAWVLATGLVAALAAAGYPLVQGQLVMAQRDPVSYERALAIFGRGLADQLAGPDALRAPDAKGLLTGWREAHPLLWHTGHPVATSTFGTDEARAGNRASFGMLLSADEGAVVSAMAERRLGILITDPVINQIENMARIAGLDERYVEIEYAWKNGGEVRNIKPLQPFYDSVLARLWLGDGSQRWPNGIQQPGLAHFRLIHESPVRKPMAGIQTPLLKAFERVAGARLTGSAPAGQPVQLRLAVQSNTGRRFTYARRVLADGDGRFQIRVPYPAPAGDSACRAMGPYRIKIGDRVIHQDVSEHAVRDGLAVEIPPEPPGE